VNVVIDLESRPRDPLAQAGPVAPPWYLPRME
jgi:hypothetical protein